MNMLPKTILGIFLVGIISWSIWAQPGFEQAQLNFTRVRTAKNEKDATLRHEFERRALNFAPKNIYLRAFKEEKILEVWVQNEFGQDYVKFRDYSFCKSSGILGPKKKQGDEQVPEGFYYIDEFNPNSKFYLSLGINYPNCSDCIKAQSSNLGGDIYIHGDCVSIGCIAITDENIKELYWLAVKTRENGQTYIPIHIFPYKFDITSPFLYEHAKADVALHQFWDNLKDAYYFFSYKRRPPFVHINDDGTYEFF